MSRGRRPWPPEHERALILFRRNGYSSTQIAAALTEIFTRRFSRGGVVGKLHRLGLTSRIAARRYYVGGVTEKIIHRADALLRRFD